MPRRFPHLFEACPISMWVCDYTHVVDRLGELREEGVEELLPWLSEDPARAAALLGLVHIEDINQATCSLIGAEDLEEVNARLQEIFNETTFEVFCHLLSALHGGVTYYESASELRRLDEEVIRVVFQFSVLGGDTPDWSMVLVTITDVSELHLERELRRELELERRLRHAQKLESLGVLAGGIAHDFNNLLVGVLGNAGLALMELPPSAPARRRIEDISNAAERAADLCRQLLAYAGKGRFVVLPVSLNEIVEDMSHLIHVSLSKSVSLEYELAPDLPSTVADRTQIQQIVMNLVTNAVEAIGEKGGTVRLSTSAIDCDAAYLAEISLNVELEEGLYLALEVSDSGEGMDSATQTRIFEPFFSTKFVGRGLGLAAVQGIVGSHRGALEVYSEVGKGTTVKVLLPASPAAAIEDPATRRPAPPRGEGRILVVDDDATVRTVACHALGTSGYDVEQASDGRRALEEVRDDPQGYDLVLLDLTMPHMGGEEAFRQIRSIRADLPVILASGYSREEVTSRFVGRAPAGFVQKPWQLEELLRTVAEALEGARCTR